MQEEARVNGTLVWYYCICQREVWLMARNIVPDQESEFLDIGRQIHENAYSRDKKELQVGNIKLDVIKLENGQLVVGEVKKTSKFKCSARMQLLFYLSVLAENGVEARGELFFPEERKREEVILNSETAAELERVKKDILRIIYLDVPPKPVKIQFCKNCAYKEFCWS